MICNVRKIQKIMCFAFLLFMCLTLDVHATEIHLDNTKDENHIYGRLVNEMYDKIILDTDISVDCFTPGGNYSINSISNSTKTLDLNGHQLSLGCPLLLNGYNDNGTINIIDSSEEKTGQLLNNILVRNCYEDGCNALTVNITGGLYNASTFIEFKEGYANNLDLNINNINFIGDTLFKGFSNNINIKNSIFKPSNKNFKILDDTSVVLLSDIIDENYKVIGNNDLITMTTEAKDINIKDSNVYIAKNVNFIEISDFETKDKWYSQMNANYISFNNSTDSDIKIKSIEIDNKTEFELHGAGELTVLAGEKLTTDYNILVKDGLSVGKHNTNVIVTDENDNLYVETVTFVVENKKISKPTITSLTTFEYDESNHEITFDGFDESAMELTGTTSSNQIGEYTATISLKDGYCWDDESTDSLEFNWNIIFVNYIKNIEIFGDENISLEKTYQYLAKIHPLDADNPNTTWTIINGTGSATIDENGILTPTKEGTITLVATANDKLGVKAELNINITTSPTKRISITADNYFLSINEKYKLNAKIYSASGDEKIVWNTSDESIATIDQNGNLTLKKIGEVSITASLENNPSIREEIEFLVYDEFTIVGKIGEKQYITAKTDKYSTKMEWIWEDLSIVESVQGGGHNLGKQPYEYYRNFTPKKIGTTTLTLHYPTTHTDLFTYRIYSYQDASISTNYSEIILEKDDILILDILPYLENLGEEINDIYFNITDPNIASIDSTGRIIANKLGNTVVEVYSKYNNVDLKIPLSVVEDKNNYTILTEEIKIDGESDNLRVGNTFNYEVTVFPTNTTKKDIIWSVENGTGTATITQDGVLTALSEGTATIKATATDGSGVVGEKEISMKTYIDVEKILLKTPNLFVSTDTSFYMNALIYPTTATNKKVKWSSSDTSIAEIDSDTGGLVTKYKVGTVTITATATDGSGVVGSIVLHVGETGIKLGETTSLGNSNYITHDQVLWEIGDETILQPTGQTGSNSINNYYKHYIYVKGLKPGQTTLTMKTIAGTTIATTTVYVYSPISSLSSNISSLELQKGETKQLEIQILPDVVSDEMSGLIYISSDDSIISVDQNGNVTSHKNGRANITVYSQYNNVSLTIPVTVTTSTTGLELDSYNVDLNQEKTSHQIIYEVLPEDASNKNVTFTSSNPNVATVNDTGLITALRNGTATITVKTEDGNHEKQITVNVANMSRLIEDLEFNEIQSVQYNGSEIKPNIIINDEDYTLVSGTDYEIEYKNNINIGTAEIIITGINAYKGTKTITFTITKADLNVNYTAMSNTVTYDGNEHGISLDIQSPNNIIVKYADDQGNYTLDNMPKYDMPGEYTIYFELSLGNNYKTIRDSKVLIINKKNLTDKTVDFEVPYGVYNENTISVSIEEPIYSVYYKHNSDDYTSLLPPTFITPGSYTVHYKVLPGLPDIYNTLYGSRKVNIFGIVSVDPALTYIHEKQVLIVRNYNFSISNILSKMNIFKNNDFIVDHEETNAQISKSDKVSTNDYITFTYKGARHNNIALAILGDVNGDGKISALDYVRIKNHIMGSSKISVTAELYSADLNEDSKISALDYVRIKNYIMNGGK